MVKSCEACFDLLNAPFQDKDNNNDKQHAAEQINNQKGYMYTLYKRLNNDHREVMEEIILGKYKEVYKYDRTRNSESIDDKIEILKKNLNPNEGSGN